MWGDGLTGAETGTETGTEAGPAGPREWGC